jgi:hypothetical protein
MSRLPVDETQITAEWLDQQLRAAGVDAGVTAVRAERIAEGVGLLGRLARLHIGYARSSSSAPATLIVKFPIELERNRQLAELYRCYEREHTFYTKVAAHTPLRLPRCYAALHDEPQTTVLLLEDLARGRLGDQVQGNSAADARAAVLALAEHHALFWEKTALDSLVDFHDDGFCQVLAASFRGALEPTFAAFPEHFTPALRELATAVGERTTAMMKRNEKRPLTVCHGDFRADNLFFDLPDGRSPAMMDFQLSARGFALIDVAYHLTQSVTTEVRRAIERPLLEEYHRVLVNHGVREFSFADLWQEYRKEALFSLAYPVTVCGALDLTNARARALGEIFLNRSLAAISDLGAADTLDL